MADPLDFVFLQCWVGAAGVTLLLFRKQTVYLGVTLLFVFQVTSASLSAFFLGRLFGLREQWIDQYHEQVLIYSGWMWLAMVGAMWMAWFALGNGRRSNRSAVNDGTFPWISEQFIYYSLALGIIGTVATPFVLHSVATVGTAATLLASWLKIGLIAAVVLFKKRGIVRPLVVAVILFLPVALINALRSGHTPFSLDVIICVALISTCVNRVTVFSFVKLFLCMIPCVYLMFAWLASRNVIRSGELEQFSMTERASRFTDVFVKELTGWEMTPDNIQELLFERIDMSDLLAQEVSFEDSSPGEDEFRYGGTLIDGLYSVVPRAIWPDKPIVAGFGDFVGRYTGNYRDDATSVGVPEQFELYANGGAPFVIVGMFLLTLLCARLERFIVLCRRPLHVLMPSMMLLMSFNNGIEQIMLVVSTALAGAAVAFAVAKVTQFLFPRLLPELQTTKPRYAPSRSLPANAWSGAPIAPPMPS
jgi:hypothetical protein